MQELKAQMVACGTSEADAAAACEKVKKLYPREREYVSKLMVMMEEEMVSFTSEIDKREDQIRELSSQLGEKYRYKDMIGKSKKMQAI